MAAAGEQVYTGPVTHALSDASPSPAAAGPMQAKRWGGSKSAKPAKKAAPKPKPKKKAEPVMQSYLDLEDVRDYNAETKRLSIYDAGSNALREDEDADFVSPEMLKAYQSRNDQKADELFHIGSGILADDQREDVEKKKIYNTMFPIFYDEEIKKGNTEYTKDEAGDKARKYARKNKPKFKRTVSEKDQKWFDQSTRDPSLDLFRSLHSRKMQAARNLIAYRENMGKLRPNENKDKLDYEASFSEDARTLSVYDMILSSMGMTPAAVEYQKQTLAKGESQEDFDTMEKALKLSTASSSGKYAETEEGKSTLPLFQQMNI